MIDTSRACGIRPEGPGVATAQMSTGSSHTDLSTSSRQSGRHWPAYFTRSLFYATEHRMNTHFLGFEYQIQVAPIATRLIELCSGLLSSLLCQSQRLWPSAGTNSPQGLFVSGLSLAGASHAHLCALGAHRRLPCRAHPRLQARVVAQADSRPSENEVSIKRSFDKTKFR